MSSLQDHVALISGGGTGIGKAIAMAFVEAGAAVAILGRGHDVLDEAVESMTSAGGRALAVAGDVSQKSACEAAVVRAVETFGKLSIVVNNAGVATPGSLAEATEDSVHAMIDIDLKGPIFLAQAALSELEKAASGGDASILNISSSVTMQALENYSVYSAAKAGLDMLTRCWARELGATRVRVNAINPGVVETPVFESMMPREDIPVFLKRFEAIVPLGRVGQPEDIARLALFLSGPESLWTTGAVIPLDGGLSLAS